MNIECPLKAPYRGGGGGFVNKGDEGDALEAVGVWEAHEVHVLYLAAVAPVLPHLLLLQPTPITLIWKVRACKKDYVAFAWSLHSHGLEFSGVDASRPSFAGGGRGLSPSPLLRGGFKKIPILCKLPYKKGGQKGGQKRRWGGGTPPMLK